MPKRKQVEPEADITIQPREELILLVLLDKELYGKQIVQAVSDVSAGQRQMKVGSVYPALHDLEEKGLATSTWGDETRYGRKGARRRYYRLTPEGSMTIREIQSFRTNLMKWKPPKQ